MPTTPFVFSSDNLPRLKAKQLARAFPFLKLAASQEATARALGHSSWYDCTQRGTQGKPSPSDQEAGIGERVVRFYHQANVLIGLGITPMDADRWVRAWGLTGTPTLAPKKAYPPFNEWNNALERLEKGEIDESYFLENFGDDEEIDDPEVDLPKRVCPGVILGPLGSHPYYAVDPGVNANIPLYLRGTRSVYHLEDSVEALKLCVPGFVNEFKDWPLRPTLNRLQHEWHYGVKHPTATASCISSLADSAMAHADEMMVISVRAMPKESDYFQRNYDFERKAVACLRGRDFSAFIRNKGILDPDRVVWYSDVDYRSDMDAFEWFQWVNSDYKSAPPNFTPIFKPTKSLTPSLPIYSYPFMTGPMLDHEYRGNAEIARLIPLADDYKECDY